MHLRRLIVLWAALGCANLLGAQARYEVVRPNDNRARAGISSGNVLAVRLEARVAVWHPSGEDQPGAAIPVFAEMGRQAQVPGPLIRVPGGTDIIATVRNAIPGQMLTIHGLHSRPVAGAAFNDSIQLVPGQITTLRFRLDRPGTYYYWGTTSGAAFGDRRGADAQLTGAIVVDEPGERAPRDRIFVIGMWGDSVADPYDASRRRELVVLNGRPWPHSDRVQYEKGDSVRWRVINASASPHPMHLHGFYFRVNRRGDGRADTAQSARDLTHTAYMPPGSTASLSWLANRLGNWLFHCAEPAHSLARTALGFPQLASSAAQRAPTGSARPYYMNEMGGLVAGVEILAAEDDTMPPEPVPEPMRRFRMLLRSNPGSTPSRPYYGVTVSETAMDAVEPIGQSVGVPLELTRGEPVSIMVHNRTPEPTTVHWHGIEIDSYYDGVAGFSGVRPEVTPVIAPSDSFEVRMTPPRAGTFTYHSHADEARQIRAGIVGAIVVSDSTARTDASRDITVLVSTPSDSADAERAVLINGGLGPAPLELRQGTSYRLRLINMTAARPALHAELLMDSTVITWRPIAQNGVELPAARRLVRTARQRISIGETLDVEFFPTRAAEYRLHLRAGDGSLLGELALSVR